MTSPAHSRSVQSFFADPGDESAAVRVCRGLSCALNGAAALEARIATRAPVRPVRCLGECDRSPALLAPDGTALCGAMALAWTGAGADLGRSPGVDVRSCARRPVVTERIGRSSHAALSKARHAGVYRGIARALEGSPAAVVELVEASGEQGRGGAGFPTGRKWRACAAAASAQRYVIANGDEGDPGSFIDRVLLEDDPHAVLEGLMICAYAVGAAEGVVFIRGEYPAAQARMEQAIVEAREAGLLGASVLGYPFAFDVRVVGGHGSYVCGEETAMLNAIEGRRGEVRVRPPFPATAGLHGKPTVVNNIETLVNVPWIMREGAEAYRALGTAGSPGTKAFCLNRGFARPGIVEAEFGLSLRDLVETHAGGSGHSSPLAAVAIGGPMGSVLTPEEWDIALDYAALRERDIRLGHGGLVAISGADDLRDVLLNWLEFMAAESCGKCVPCGLGSRQAFGLAHQLRQQAVPDAALIAGLNRLMATIEATSLCGFGQGIARPVMTLARLEAGRERALEDQDG